MATVGGYVTLDKASLDYKLSVRRLQQLCKEGAVKAKKVGGLWLVRPESVEEYCKGPRHRPRA